MMLIFEIMSIRLGSFFLFLMVIFTFSKSPSEVDINTEINWISFEEAVARTKENPKMILVDLYTDWCGWCKKMDASTFKNADVVSYMKENYYSIKLDAERKEDLIFRGDTFKFVQNGRRGYNQFAVALLDSKMSFPSFVALNEKVQIITVLPGFMEAPVILPILNYISDEKYLTIKYDDYLKTWKE